MVEQLKYNFKKYLLGLSNTLGSEIKENKAIFFAVILIFLVLVSGSYAFLGKEDASEIHEQTVEEVLGAAAQAIDVSPPSATDTPQPTMFPTIKNTIRATATPAPAVNPSSPTSTPTPNSNSNSSSSSSPTAVPTQSPTEAPTAIPTPTPATQSIEVHVDYAGQRSADSYTTNITPNETAWEAIQAAVGGGNLQFKDYGGDMGIFITGFNGVAASSSQYYEFRVNGASSSVGISSYHVANNDNLDFVLTSF